MSGWDLKLLGSVTWTCIQWLRLLFLCFFKRPILLETHTCFLSSQSSRPTQSPTFPSLIFMRHLSSISQSDLLQYINKKIGNLLLRPLLTLLSHTSSFSSSLIIPSSPPPLTVCPTRISHPITASPLFLDLLHHPIFVVERQRHPHSATPPTCPTESSTPETPLTLQHRLQFNEETFLLHLLWRRWLTEEEKNPWMRNNTLPPRCLMHSGKSKTPPLKKILMLSARWRPI